MYALIISCLGVAVSIISLIVSSTKEDKTRAIELEHRLTALEENNKRLDRIEAKVDALLER